MPKQFLVDAQVAAAARQLEIAGPACQRRPDGAVLIQIDDVAAELESKRRPNESDSDLIWRVLSSIVDLGPRRRQDPQQQELP